jgi:hypothetical protein
MVIFLHRCLNAFFHCAEVKDVQCIRVSKSYVSMSRSLNYKQTLEKLLLSAFDLTTPVLSASFIYLELGLSKLQAHFTLCKRAGKFECSTENHYKMPFLNPK